MNTKNATPIPGYPGHRDLRRDRLVWAAFLGFLVLAGLLAYSNSLFVPFVYDDSGSIVFNPTIRSLWPFWNALSPPAAGGLTVSGRPVLNVSLAINHAISGQGVWSYHVLNLAIHLAAGLALAGIVRRTLLLPALASRFGAAAIPIAGAVAALWTLHPIQTEAVTYVVQRSESLMGLFYLLTLYGFIRAAGPGAGAGAAPQSVRTGWWAVTVISCLLGMGTKEVMVSAPLIVLLYDRTFLSGTLRAAWTRNCRLHLALFLTWIPLALLVASTGGNRGGTIGFGAAGVSWWGHFLTQFRAITRYLELSIWPHPLVFDYGPESAGSAAQVAPFAVLVTGLAVLAFVALKFRPALGFLGIWFFAVLAPTSALPGAIQMTVEHRMYIALAPVVVLLVVALHRMAGKAGIPLCLAVAAGFTYLTFDRNRDYRSELSIWQDTALKRPQNVIAQYNCGLLLFKLGRVDEAIGHYERALQLSPDYPDVRNNLGVALTQAGRNREAIVQFGEVLRLDPKQADAFYNMGMAYRFLGEFDRAILSFREAVRMRPDFIDAWNTLGITLVDVGQVSEAIALYEQTLARRPGYFDTLNNLGCALMKIDRNGDAIARFEQALAVRSDSADLFRNLGIALAKSNRMTDAATRFERAAQLEPGNADTRTKLATVYAALGREKDAATERDTALRLQSAKR